MGGGCTEVEQRTEGGSTDVRVGGCCIPKLAVVVWSFCDRTIGTGILGMGFSMTDVALHGLGLSLVGGGWSEIERRTEGGSTDVSGGGRMLHSKVDGCCVELFGTSLLGRGFWERVLL